MDMNPQEQAMLEYFTLVGSQNPAKEGITRKQKQIEMMRKGLPSAEGSMTQTGAGQPSIYVRPSALSSLANIGGQAFTGYQQGATDAAATQLGTQHQDAFKAMLEQMRKRQGGGAPDQGDVLPYGPGSGWNQA